MTARPTASSSPLPGVDGGTEHRSLAARALLDGLSEERRYGILDLGAAFGGNIDFLAPFASHLRIEDLYATLAAAGFLDRDPGDPAAERLAKLVPLAGSRPFDLVLAWDLFDYLRPADIAALSRHLEPFCRPGARLFALASILREIPAEPGHYLFHDRETLVYRSRTRATKPAPRRTPREMSKLLAGFEVESSFLMRHGVEEYLFVRAAAPPAGAETPAGSRRS